MIVHEDGRPGDYMYCVAATPCDPGTGMIPVPHETAGPPFYSNQQACIEFLFSKSFTRYLQNRAH